MKLYLASLVVLSVLLVQAGTSFSMSSNWFFSVQEGGFRCVDVILPDDSGYTGLGTFEYIISCEPFEECISWGTTVTEERVAASENNTGIIPVCFIVPEGNSIGNCSAPMTISVESLELGLLESWEGGICVSRYEDFDSSERLEDQGVEDVLNENFDLFDVGFIQPRIFTVGGENITYRLFIESYAEITLDMEVEPGILDVSPSQTNVSLSGENPNASVDYLIEGIIHEGSYYLNVNVNARARDCSGSYCTRRASGVIVVSSDPDEVSGEGFSVSLFPQSINVKELGPVVFRLSVQNFGERALFEPSIKITPSAASTFSEEPIDLEKGEEITRSFIVRPTNTSALYEVSVSVGPEAGSSKRVVSYLSTNEMVTDILRLRDAIEDPDKLNEVSDDVDQWYQEYRDSDYGSDLESYNSLRDALSEAGMEPEEPPEEPPPPDDEEEPEPLNLIWLVPVVMAVIFILVLIVWIRKKPSGVETDLFQR
jgi:hypothetical protein